MRTALRQAVENGVLVPTRRGHVPVPPRPGRRSCVLDDPAGRARGAPRTARPGASAEGPPRRPSSRRTGRRRDGRRRPSRLRGGRGQAEAFGLAEAHGHLERALALWDDVPDAAALPVDLAGLCSRTAELASQAGAAPRAVELAERAIKLAGDRDPAADRCMYASAGTCTRAAGTSRAVGVRTRGRARPAADRGAGAGARGVRPRAALAWRLRESLVVCEQALALARAAGARRPRCGRSPSSAATSPTSAAARRAWPSSAGPCGSPRKSAIRSPWSRSTSRSRTC